MNKYRTFRGKIVQTMADGKVVDPFMMGMIEHHANTPEEAAHIREFCSVRGFAIRHLDILLLNIGRRTPFLGRNIHVDSWEGDRMVTCSMWLDNGLTWNDSRLKCEDSVLPETIRSTMRGRGVGDLLSHPYLPKDLAIASITQGTSHWVATFNANARVARPAA